MRVHYRHDKVVETSHGDAFIRRGKSRRKLSDDEKRDLRNSKGQLDLEQEPVSLSYPDDFKLPLIAQFIAGVRSIRSLSNDLTIEEILELRHLGKIKNGYFQPNLACALLFAKDPESIVQDAALDFFVMMEQQKKPAKTITSSKASGLKEPSPSSSRTLKR